MAKPTIASVLVGGAAGAVGVGGAALALAIVQYATGASAGTLATFSGTSGAGLVLELHDDSDVNDTDVFDSRDGRGSRIGVNGTNRTGEDVVLRDAGVLRPGLVLPKGCPAGSFEVTDASLRSAEIVIAASGPTRYIGDCWLHFVSLDADQTACFDTSITFVWPEPGTPGAGG